MDCEDHAKRLEAFVSSRDYAGYDPYDALNGPLVRALTLGTKWGRIAWTQLFRRLPFNLRPFLGVGRGHNPKGIGLFLWGYAKRYALGRDTNDLKKVERLLALLDELKSPNCTGHAWGYNFDWQSRAAYVPKGTPTIVNSSFIGHALLDTHEHIGNQAALDLALPIADFILNDLRRSSQKDAFCFSYTPVDENYVHNANMLGASILLRINQHSRDDTHLEAAHSSLRYSMSHQRDDGSWYYAERGLQHWIDSFHTGFNLQALRYFLQANEGSEYAQAYNHGVAYYVENFFLEDGTPKYYHDRIYPIDIHAPMQAIAFFAGEGERYEPLTTRILTWVLANMWDRRGFFYFRKLRWFNNRIPYMRWGQAWAFHALTELLFRRSATCQSPQ